MSSGSCTAARWQLHSGSTSLFCTIRQILATSRFFRITCDSWMEKNTYFFIAMCTLSVHNLEYLAHYSCQTASEIGDRLSFWCRMSCRVSSGSPRRHRGGRGRQPRRPAPSLRVHMWRFTLEGSLFFAVPNGARGIQRSRPPGPLGSEVAYQSMRTAPERTISCKALRPGRTYLTCVLAQVQVLRQNGRSMKIAGSTIRKRTSKCIMSFVLSCKLVKPQKISKRKRHICTLRQAFLFSSDLAVLHEHHQMNMRKGFVHQICG